EALKHGIKRGDADEKGTDRWSKVYYCKPTLEQGLIDWMRIYFKCRNSEREANKLLLVIKKLWLTPEADAMRFDGDPGAQPMNEWDAGIVCKFEFYLEKDSMFYPLYRIDSVFTYEKKLNDFAGMRFVDNASSFIDSALKSALIKMSSINFNEVITKRRKLSIKDIEKDYLLKNELPVLNIPTFNKGVYKDFGEFKKNAPSITQFEFRQGPMGDIVYLKEGNTEYPARKIWGFSDGLNVYINSGDKYSRLTRHGNSFYFFGIKGVSRKSKHVFMRSSGLNYANNSGVKKTVYKLETKYYQLDMETGEAY
ncbi:MAG TPA: hypothetical protein VK484_04160, partial [Ferruginibacter sp.]|nr:hypothetical protein [Ferruginibacter sp.]